MTAQPTGPMPSQPVATYFIHGTVMTQGQTSSCVVYGNPAGYATFLAACTDAQNLLANGTIPQNVPINVVLLLECFVSQLPTTTPAVNRTPISPSDATVQFH